MSVHPNQKECGDSILRAFKEDPSLARVLLLAQMQMGKSGTYWYVILNMLLNSEFDVDHVAVISGNRETELYEQVKQDKEAYIDWFFKDASQDVLLRKKADENIVIAWGSDLMKGNAVIQPNTLIVWDESHYAQSRTNSPDVFFKRNNLSNLVNGSEPLLNERKIRLLTVSATPFSELLTQSTECKMFKLIPDATYCGVKTYMEKKAIQASFVINADNRTLLANLLQKHAQKDKYMLMRVCDNKTSKCIVKSVCDELGICLKQYNSRIKDLEIKDLSIVPTQPTLILVSGMLRMGKVIPKEHISMVFEASTKSKSRPTDTSLQGLLGRMCGYTSRPSGFDVQIYVDPKILVYIDEYIESYESDQGPIVGNAMNVRENKPVKKVLNAYHVIQMPILDKATNMPFLTAKGNPKKKPIQMWLSDPKNVEEIVKNAEIGAKITNMLNNPETMVKCCNAESDVYGGIRRMIDRCCEASNHNTTGFCYKTIDTCSINIMSYPSKESMWIVFRNLEHNLDVVDEESDEEENVDTSCFYVLNKCVFKKE